MTVICICCRRQHGEHDPTCQHAYDRRYFETPPLATGELRASFPARPWAAGPPKPLLATSMRDGMREALKALHLPGATQ